MDLAEHDDAQEEEESVLRHIKLEPTENLRPAGEVASRSAGVESAEESSDAESGVLVKAEGDQEELESMPINAEEGDDDADTLLGGVSPFPFLSRRRIKRLETSNEWTLMLFLSIVRRVVQRSRQLRYRGIR